MTHVHVARQAIFDRDRQVHGYELLFRSAADADRAHQNGDGATTQVIVNTVTEFGLEKLVGNHPAFLNLTRPFLVGTLPLPVEPQSAVLEVLEHVRIDDDVVAGCVRLAEQGYRIALDDVVWTPEIEPLLDVASYAKLDVSMYSPESFASAVKLFTDRGLACVAERIETHDVLAMAHDLGCAYFQGHALARPDVLTSQALGPAQAACLDLLGRLSDPDVEMEDVERLVRLDVGLSYRLLRAVNSSALGLKRKVSSVGEALVLLGLAQLRSWLLLMVLADGSPASSDQLTNALTRARTCELVAHEVRVKPESAFMVGMLSSLDVLLGAPLADVLERMPLDDESRAALLERQGPLGRMLDAVYAYESGDLARLESVDVDMHEMSHAYLSAVAWSLQTYGMALQS